MPQAAWVPDLEAFVKQIMAETSTPGLALAVAINGETVYEGGFGERDRAQGLAVESDTIFGVGSITKSFTALSLMQLEEAGKLSVSDPVEKYLGGFRMPHPVSDKPITIHNLLTHSSGMPEEPVLVHGRAGSMRRDPDIRKIRGMQLPRDFFEPAYAAKDIGSWPELVSLVAGSDFPMLGAPGTQVSYSNEGFALLQGVVETVSGRPLRDYFNDNIWQPLGLEHTGRQDEMLAKYDNVTQLFARGDEGVFQSPAWHDIGSIIGNGGLASNTGDLLRYLGVYRNMGTVGGKRIASNAAIEKMTGGHVPTPLDTAYGYGLHVQANYHGVTLVGHSGGNKGISADMQMVRERGITAVALTNLSGAPAARATTAAINAVLGLPVETPRVEFPEYGLDAEAMREYEGTYPGEREQPRFWVESSALQLERDGIRSTLRPYAKDRFLNPGVGPLRFLRDESGAVWGVYLGSRTLVRAKE